jgi:hypothetical protein
MTLREFDKLRLSIEREKFICDCEPISYGIKRAIFQQNKLKRLIAAAKQVDMKMARTKLALWERQLERAGRTQTRFEKIRDESRAHALASAS